MAALRIAQAQINTVVGDISGNAAKIKHYMQEAASMHADFAVFPELALSGYPPEDLLLKPRFLKDCKEALEALLPHTRGTNAVIGFPREHRGKVYNAAAVINNGELKTVYHKIELPNYGVFDEKRYFTPGGPCPVLLAAGARVGVTICEDLWVPDGLPERCARRDKAGLVINLSASPFYAGKIEDRKAAVTGFAKRTKAFLAYTNVAGAQDELVFDGGSMVVDPSGNIISSAPRFSEQMLVTDVEVQEEHETAIDDGEDDSAVRIQVREQQDRQPFQNQVAPELDLLAEVIEALVLGIRDYADKNGFDKAVVGLSGGIDSSLTAALATMALGSERVVSVTMPSQYSSEETRRDAEALAQNMGIEIITVPISDVFQAFQQELAPRLGEGEQGVTLENLQARIRGNIMMALSNRFGWLVLATGNKSETAVGYATLYGDTAGGFAAIKDVPKTMVYRLAKRINRDQGKELIPVSVIKRPPTAELRPGQRDQDSLPPYEVLDPILEAYVEKDCSSEEIAAQGHDIDTVRGIIRMVDKNEYKRRQAPPGIKITPKAFGKDRRLPITSRYEP